MHSETLISLFFGFRTHTITFPQRTLIREDEHSLQFIFEGLSTSQKRTNPVLLRGFPMNNNVNLNDRVCITSSMVKTEYIEKVRARKMCLLEMLLRMWHAPQPTLGPNQHLFVPRRKLGLES